MGSRPDGHRRAWRENTWGQDLEPDPAPALFPAGNLRITAEAARVMREVDTPFQSLLRRHLRGDRGLANGMHGKISIYRLASKKIVIMTENGETLIALEEEVQ